MAEVSIGLFAACLPPLGPLIRRIPSPLDIYASLRHKIASLPYPSSNSQQAEKSSSAEHIVNVGMPKRQQHGRAGPEKAHEHEILDQQGRGVEMTQYAGFREMV